MSKLSPTTQAVYDAFNRVALYNEPTFATDRKALAAAFLAAIDIIIPVSYEDVYQDGRTLQYRKDDPIRNRFLTIVDEFEMTSDG